MKNQIKRLFLIIFLPLIPIGYILGKICGQEYNCYHLSDWLYLFKNIDEL